MNSFRCVLDGVLTGIFIGITCTSIGFAGGLAFRPNQLHMEPVATFPNGDSVWLHQKHYERPDVHLDDWGEFGVDAHALTSKSIIDIRWHERKNKP
jgi:hypothetical protein